MKGFKVLKRISNNAKNVLLSLNLINKEHIPKYDNTYLYFPLVEDYSIIENKELDFDYSIVDCTFKPKTKTSISFRDALKNILTLDELKVAKTAYDIVGDIAIIEIEDSLISKEKEIANRLLETNKNIKVVLKKAGHHTGVYRTQSMTYLAGENRKETIHRENNVKFNINPETVYFSIRLSTERKRIASQVKPNEDVLCMFAGAAPYPCVISKNTKAKSITAIEINPEGYKLGLENIKLNKLTNIKSYLGDVREIIPKLNQKFDRITMPLPKTAEEFLDLALEVSKSTTIIHLYAFYHEDQFQKAYDEVEKYCKQYNKQYKILQTVKCGQHAPRVWRICLDIQLLN